MSNNLRTSEFEFITNLRKIAGKFSGASSRVGIGDDCAVLPKDSKTDMVITADLLVEGIDFRLEWTKPEFIGHKALAVSLSDIAAMGAKPVWAMTSIVIPAKIWDSDFVDKFYQGWFGLAEKFGVELVGGDVSKTPDKIVIDSIVVGEAAKGKAVLRSKAKPGDLIFVTGSLGGAAAGLELLQKGERVEKSRFNSLLFRQLTPDPQSETGEIIGAEQLATAMIDLSDGLSSDLAHICHASRVGARVYAEKIPVDKAIFLHRRKAAQKEERKNPFSANLDLALHGGEDFELLFTANPKKIFRLEKALKNGSFSAIGEINANVEIIELIDREKSIVLEPKGFRHF